GPAIARVRQLTSSARLCAYGLYAPLNAEWLRSIGVDDVLGGEFEEELTAIADRCGAGLQACEPDAGLKACGTPEPRATPSALPRIHFLVPDRRGMLPLDRYATLTMPDGTKRVVGSTEASRGCKHLCRH